MDSGCGKGVAVGIGVAVKVGVGDGVIVDEGVIEDVAFAVAPGVGVLPLKEQAASRKTFTIKKNTTRFIVFSKRREPS